MDDMKKNKVFDFGDPVVSESSKVGVKGLHLSELSKLAIPVPHGFIISSECFFSFVSEGEVTPELEREYLEHIETLEKKTNRQFGGSATSPSPPLLISVRASSSKITSG